MFIPYIKRQARVRTLHNICALLFIILCVGMSPDIEGSFEGFGMPCCCGCGGVRLDDAVMTIGHDRSVVLPESNWKHSSHVRLT